MQVLCANRGSDSDGRATLFVYYPEGDITAGQAVAIEALITCILVITYLGSTNQRRKGHVYMSAIPVGMAYSLGIMSAVGSVTVLLC